MKSPFSVLILLTTSPKKIDTFTEKLDIFTEKVHTFSCEADPFRDYDSTF